MCKKRDDVPLSENESVSIEKITKIRKDLKTDQIREGHFKCNV